MGIQIYDPRTTEFSVHQGSIFANLILADEINRAPEKKAALVGADLIRFSRPTADQPRKFLLGYTDISGLGVSGQCLHPLFELSLQ